MTGSLMSIKITDHTVLDITVHFTTTNTCNKKIISLKMGGSEKIINCTKFQPFSTHLLKFCEDVQEVCKKHFCWPLHSLGYSKDSLLRSACLSAQNKTDRIREETKHIELLMKMQKIYG